MPPALVRDGVATRACEAIAAAVAGVLPAAPWLGALCLRWRWKQFWTRASMLRWACCACVGL
eukprot:5847871-Prorocentrum_lima.AAC.1